MKKLNRKCVKMDKLPELVNELISEHLSYDDLQNLRLTCKALKQIVDQREFKRLSSQLFPCLNNLSTVSFVDIWNLNLFLAEMISQRLSVPHLRRIELNCCADFKDFGLLIDNLIVLKGSRGNVEFFLNGEPIEPKEDEVKKVCLRHMFDIIENHHKDPERFPTASHSLPKVTKRWTPESTSTTRTDYSTRSMRSSNCKNSKKPRFIKLNYKT